MTLLTKTCNITVFLILPNNIGDTAFYWSILSKRKDHDRFVIVDWTPGISQLFYWYLTNYIRGIFEIFLMNLSWLISTIRSFIIVEMCRKIKKRLVSYPKFYSLKIIHVYEYHNQSLTMATKMLVTSWESVINISNSTHKHGLCPTLVTNIDVSACKNSDKGSDQPWMINLFYRMDA